MAELRYPPHQVGVGTAWTAVAAGGEHTCAVLSGQLWCWGDNDYGECATGSTSSAVVPSRSGTATDWSAVIAGYHHACGLEGSALSCWGRNREGEVGIGTTVDVDTPMPVAGAWRTVAAQSGASCGIQTSGALWCWGTSGTIVNSTAPVQVGTVTTWDTVTVGDSHICATQSDHSLWCWGGNDYGQLGYNTVSSNPQPTPKQVGTSTVWLQPAGGYQHTCAVRTDHTLWCWGHNASGQLGDGTRNDTVTPTQVGTGATWASVALGAVHTCALQMDGTLWCWGDNTFGQIGDGNGSQTAPAFVSN
jgi:alpha-tubulin suppressor-like RCC1 family protein